MKEQNKYDQMPSGLYDRVQRILPLAKKVAHEIVSEETEILNQVPDAPPLTSMSNSETRFVIHGMT